MATAAAAAGDGTGESKGKADWGSDEEEDWDSDRNEETGDVQLGFVEPVDDASRSKLLFNNANWHDWDGGKIGGKPIWLDPKELPTTKEIQCSSCSEPLLFLVQIYCPQDDVESAFHRCVYVFVCPRAQCTHSRGSVVALRCQLPRSNPYYAHQPSQEGGGSSSSPPSPRDALPGARGHRSAPEAWGVELCHVCGARADSGCARCRKLRYCSRLHQRLHWRAGHRAECQPSEHPPPPPPLAAEHAEAAASTAVAAAGVGGGAAAAEGGEGAVGAAQLPPNPATDTDTDAKPAGAAAAPAVGSGGKKGTGKGAAAKAGDSPGVFPEYEVVVEEEMFDADKRRAEDHKLMSRFTGLKVEDAGPDAGLSQAELDKATGLSEMRGYQGKKDPLSMLFLSRVREAGKQVLRYDRGGKPLWCCTKGLPRPSSPEDIPPCPGCSQQRTYEFQVMPQLLHYLRADSGAGAAAWERSEKEGKGRGSDEHAHPAMRAGLDWGVLAVYSCPGSCGEGGGYVREVVWRQGPMDGMYVDSDDEDSGDDEGQAA